MKHSLTSRRYSALALTIAAATSIAACSTSRSGSDSPLAQTAADSARAVEAAHALIGPDAKAALDRGNELFKKHAYAGALTEYRAASAMAPQHSAPLFGIYMVARATKDTAMANSALAGIRLRGGAKAPAPHPVAPPEKKSSH